MKKYILALLVLCAAPLWSYYPDDCWQQCCEGHDCRDRESRTFMFTRSLNDHLSINQSFRQNFMYKKSGCQNSAAEMSVAFQKSNTDPRFGRYFLFNCKDELLAAGDAITDLKGERDIRAEWLGLSSNFSGRFSINPRQHQFGILMAFNRNLRSFCDHPMLDHGWLQIETPIVLVENHMDVQQFDLRNPSKNYPGDLISALDQPNWEFAKFSNCLRSKITLAEINIKLGATYLAEDDFLIAYYSLISLPTGHASNSEYLFDAFAGNNGHVGYGGGVVFQVVLNENTQDYVSSIFFDLQSTFLIRHYQMRTFDLLKRPWSRYLLLTPRRGPLGSTVPGVNVLTRQVRVHPFAMADFTGGFRFKKSCCELEIGFDIWGHASENIDFMCPFPEDFGIAANTTGIDPTTLLPGVYNVTASESTIQFQANPDTDENGNYIFIPIVQSMLDQKSASSQAALNYKFHMSLCYIKHGLSVDGVAGIGCFFDFPYHNSALQLIGGWIKLGAAF
jgi:hypothetical protein